VLDGLVRAVGHRPPIVHHLDGTVAHPAQTEPAATAAAICVPWRITWAPVAALAVAGVPFAAFTILVLHHFYVRGGFFYDSGLLAFLLSEQDPHLHTPRIFGGESFFATHVTPIFVVAALIRRLLPVTDPQFFAGFTGLCHALPGLGTFWLLHSGLGLRRPLGAAVAAAVAIAFSFNGLALAIARYPHFEMLIVGTFILFFAIIALLYSITVLGLQLTTTAGQSSFARIYLGDRPFSTLTFAAVTELFLGWFLYRPYIVLPAIIAVVWALRAQPVHRPRRPRRSLARKRPDRAIEQLARSKTELGVVLVDGSVHALAPDGYASSETLWGTRTRRRIP